MEITFAVLLWGVRILFLVLLYLFLIRVFSSLQRALATENTIAARPTGLAHLVVQRTVRGAFRVGDRLPLRAVNGLGRDAGNHIVQADGVRGAGGLPRAHAVSPRLPRWHPLPRRSDPPADRRRVDRHRARSGAAARLGSPPPAALVVDHRRRRVRRNDRRAP